MYRHNWSARCVCGITINTTTHLYLLSVPLYSPTAVFVLFRFKRIFVLIQDVWTYYPDQAGWICRRALHLCHLYKSTSNIQVLSLVNSAGIICHFLLMIMSAKYCDISIFMLSSLYTFCRTLNFENWATNKHFTSTFGNTQKTKLDHFIW